MNNSYTCLIIVLLFLSNLSQSQPIVMDVNPEPNSENVPLFDTGMIKVVFSEKMNKTSVEEALTSDMYYPFNYLIDRNYHKWLNDSTISLPSSFMPNFAFKYETTYEITIKNTAQSITGENLESDYSWCFRTIDKQFDSVETKSIFTYLFDSIFNVVLSDPPIIENRTYGFQIQHYTSVVYFTDTVYRIYLLPDFQCWQVKRCINDKRPAGDFDVLVLCVDYGNTNIGQIYNSIWTQAQDQVNNKIKEYSISVGLNEEIVFFNNTNILVLKDEIGNPGSFGDVLDYLSTINISEDDFDIFISLALDAQNPSGGYTNYGGRFIYMGHFFSSTNYAEYTFEQLGMIARACYEHEMGHIWGWEHDWGELTNDFVFSPYLFGWHDIDEDSILEIYDPTPYGGAFRITRQPESKTLNIGDTSNLSISVEGSDSLSFEWYKDNMLISSSSNILELINVSQNDSGYYYCRVFYKSLYKYSDTVFVKIENSFGMDKLIAWPFFSVTPNPVNDYAEIEYKLEKPAKVEIKIFNNMGKLIEAFTCNGETGHNKQIWRPLGNVNGVYYISIRADNNYALKKIVLIQ